MGEEVRIVAEAAFPSDQDAMWVFVKRYHSDNGRKEYLILDDDHEPRWIEYEGFDVLRPLAVFSGVEIHSGEIPLSPDLFHQLVEGAQARTMTRLRSE